MVESIARTRTRMKASAGFTLIEMMIVVAIIGIIAAIVAVNYAHSKSNAQVAATEANLKQIGTALELYYSDNQAYPASGNVAPTLFGGASNQYLNVTPNAPGSSGGNYVYTLASNGNTYSISDPDTYDAASIGNLPKGTATQGSVTTNGKCGTGCTHVGYSNSVGIYGF